jgi:hypothetical protein
MTVLSMKYKPGLKDGDVKTQCVFPPLPLSFIRRSQATGGNVMGLEQHDSDGIIWGLHVTVLTAELETWALPRVRKVYEDLQIFVTFINGLLTWTTANHAHPTQDVFSNYGKGNVQKMRDAAAKYDPDGVSQHLCPGGFKISKVKD